MNTLESRLYRRFWDDGLLDLFAGVGILGIGISWAVDLVALGAIIPAILAPFWPLLRRALVEPRAGHVEFADTRTSRDRRLGTGSVIIGVGTLLIFVGLYMRAQSGPTEVLSALVPGVPAFLLGLMGVVAGWWLGLPRFLAYAGALCAGGVGVALVDARPEIAMFAGAAVILASGLWRLLRFLQLPVEPSA